MNELEQEIFLASIEYYFKNGTEGKSLDIKSLSNSKILIDYRKNHDSSPSLGSVILEEGRLLEVIGGCDPEFKNYIIQRTSSLSK